MYLALTERIAPATIVLLPIEYFNKKRNNRLDFQIGDGYLI